MKREIERRSHFLSFERKIKDEFHDLHLVCIKVHVRGVRFHFGLRLNGYV